MIGTIIFFTSTTNAAYSLSNGDAQRSLFKSRMICTKHFAQFIAVCSSAKPCELGENLLSVSDPISRPEERLSHVGARIRPPTLQRRSVSRLHPYITME